MPDSLQAVRADRADRAVLRETGPGLHVQLDTDGIRADRARTPS